MPSWKVLARLTKLRIAIASVASAVTGALVCAGRPSLGLAAIAVAVLFLAMGACALNEWQECDLDARMARTRRRPLPAGQVRPNVALALALLLVAGGTLILVLVTAHGLIPALLGLMTVAWYNGVYTPLKRLTALAAIPGGLVGMGAPAIGWTAAGGPLADPRLLALVFFFFVWQVPHFWLLLLRHAADYESAGLPTLSALVGPTGLTRLTLVWLVTAAASAPLLALFGLARSPWIALALLTAGLLLAAGGLTRLPTSVPAGLPSTRGLFGAINVFACVVMLLLVADAWF